MKEYVLGNLVGISQVIIGHPFDTLKTNIQNANVFANKILDIRLFIKHPITLYKGVSYPLVMNCIGTSLLFGNYNYFYKETNNRLLSGILTGIISAIILTPFDYKKIQLQIQKPYSPSPHTQQTQHTQQTHKTLYDKYKYNYKSIKNIKKYYIGFSYALGREIIATPIYFYSYYYLSDITNPFIAGGISGINSWLFSYPIDTLKTRKQIFHQKTFKELCKIGSLYNGLSITLLRAFIVNGSSFYLYDLFKQYNSNS